MGNSYALSDGTNVVSLSPDYDLKLGGKKIEVAHRTRSGALYKYKFGQYDSVKFKVEYVNSAAACQINSWWGSNTALVLRDTSSSAVCSGYLSNASEPIDQMVKPYIDQFMGTIELESF